MRYTWDEQKNSENRAKHGISFELATLVFGDPHQVTVPDPCEADERWDTIGVVKGVVEVFVAHTISEQEDENGEIEEEIRIISARRATRRERDKYYEHYESCR